MRKFLFYGYIPPPLCLQNRSPSDCVYQTDSHYKIYIHIACMNFKYGTQSMKHKLRIITESLFINDRLQSTLSLSFISTYHYRMQRKFLKINLSSHCLQSEITIKSLVLLTFNQASISYEVTSLVAHSFINALSCNVSCLQSFTRNKSTHWWKPCFESWKIWLRTSYRKLIICFHS